MWKLMLTTLVLLPIAVQAQPAPQVEGANGVYVLQAAEKLKIGCTFTGRTITNANKGTAVAVLRKSKQADANPTAMLVTHSASVAGDNYVDVQVYPDYGCGAAGCRAGNEYEIILQPTDSSGDQPLCNLYVIVRTKVLVR